MDMWLFRGPVATKVASKGILLDTADVTYDSLDQIF